MLHLILHLGVIMVYLILSYEKSLLAQIKLKQFRLADLFAIRKIYLYCDTLFFKHVQHLDLGKSVK